MQSDLIAAVFLIIAALLFLIYKRNMIARLFSLDIAGQVDDFKYDLQSTASKAVDKVTLASGELSELLQQAEETIAELKLRTKIAEEQLYKNTAKELQANTASAPQETPPQIFAETLARAARSVSPHLDLPPAERPVFNNAYYDNESASITRQKEEEPEPSIDMSGAEPRFRYKQIMRLAASGYNDIDIAKTLGLGVGEVSLTRKFGVK